MNDYIIEPAKIENYESILELYNELHEVNTNFEVYKINGKTIGVVEYAV